MKKFLYSICLVFMIFGCGEDGKDGDPGMSGFSSLLLVTQLPSGDSNCPNGGSRIDTGIDNGDNEGIAGNDILEEGEIDNTAYICNGEDGTGSGETEQLKELSLANFGSSSYTGFEAVSFSDRFPTTNLVDKIEMGVFVDKAADPDSISRVRSLIRFRDIQDQIDELIEDTEKGNIIGATLFINVSSSAFDVPAATSDIPYIEFGLFSVNGPSFPSTATGRDWVKDEVTWIEMQSGESWETSGMYQQVIINRWDDKAFVSNAGTGVEGRGWHVMRLDTAQVSDWAIDKITESNRGILLTIAENFAIEQGAAVNTAMEIDNVLLHLEIEVETIAVGGRVAGSQSNVKPWSDRTNAERYTPLQRYLNKE